MKIVLLPCCGDREFGEIFRWCDVPDGYDVTHIQCESGSSNDAFTITRESDNFKHIRVHLGEKGLDYLNNLSGDMVVLGTGSDRMNPCRNEIWGEGEFIDKMRNNFDFLLMGENGSFEMSKEFSEKWYWGKGSNPRFETYKYLLDRSDGYLGSCLPHIDSNVKIWDHPLICSYWLGGEDIGRKTRAFNHSKYDRTKKYLCTVNYSWHMASIYDRVLKNKCLLESMSESEEERGDLFFYNIRIPSELPIKRFQLSEYSEEANLYIENMGLGNRVCLDSFWEKDMSKVHEAINEKFYFGFEDIEFPIHELLLRSAVDFALAGVPVISPPFYYPSIIFPNLNINERNSQEKINDMLNKPYSFFEDDCIYAQNKVLEYDCFHNKNAHQLFFQYLKNFLN